MPCQIPYIPERLHSNDRPSIDAFTVGEHLYRRCSEKEKANPFLTISLVDISVNRSGYPLNSISEPDDVLFNTTPEKFGELEKLPMAVVTLEITELQDNQYKKEQTFSRQLSKKDEPETHSCQIHLRHKKEPCNFSHCAFEVFYDGVELTFENHDNLIGRNKPLRTWCKHELARMIIKEEVRINWPNESEDSMQPV